jgi:hypothetical protein
MFRIVYFILENEVTQDLTKQLQFMQNHSYIHSAIQSLGADNISH